ncbi:hypothetical protein AtDm6_2094 [Acetobacter tropicalis]|uniref:Uncharacterized protein n=2 Tax=Acetobacter tropicalis TaxID=104102 RepID=F7VEC5_9PROT|nr:hypothetical protein AtDm6_2094 [Acetobacter tropicalis]GAA08720.1 hypothetical protein ATPR_1724 [Acetobacter tropicalis NBRC 101654]
MPVLSHDQRLLFGANTTSHNSCMLRLSLWLPSYNPGLCMPD